MQRVIIRQCKIGRDARNGRFIAVRNAKERPSTTTVETIKVIAIRDSQTGRFSPKR